MNKLYLFFCRVKQYIVKNKGIFALFLIGGMLNTVMVLYCYGNLLPTVANRYKDTADYRSYTLRFENAPPDKSSIEEFVQHTLLESYLLIDQKMVGVRSGDYPLRLKHGTLEFTEPYQMLVKASSKYIVGNRVEYMGKTFTVIGITFSDYNFIPYDTFVALGGLEQVKTIRMIAATRQDPANDPFAAFLQNLFPNCTSFRSDGEIQWEREKVADETQTEKILTDAIISVIAYAFLLYYVINSRRQENAVCMVLGTGKKKLACFVFLEALFLCAATCLGGIVFHILFYKQIFQPINITNTMRYEFRDYLNVFLLMAGLSLLSVIPVTVRAVLSTPADARRRAS